MQYVFYLFIALILFWYLLRMLRLRGVVRIEPAQVRDMLKDRSLLLLDVRTPREVSQRKMKGAMNIPLSDLQSRVSELAPHKSKHIVVVCASGSRSLGAAALLTKNGFTASSMTGGLMAWRD